MLPAAKRTAHSIVVRKPDVILKVEQARDLLAAARSVDEVKKVRDQAAAVRLYLRTQEAGKGVIDDGGEIILRANRRLGELSATLERAPAGRKKKESVRATDRKESALEAHGIPRQRAAEYEELARVPEPAFDGHIAALRESRKGVTMVGALRLARQEESPVKPKRTKGRAAAAAEFRDQVRRLLDEEKLTIAETASKLGTSSNRVCDAKVALGKVKRHANPLGPIVALAGTVSDQLRDTAAGCEGRWAAASASDTAAAVAALSKLRAVVSSIAKQLKAAKKEG